MISHQLTPLQPPPVTPLPDTFLNNPFSSESPISSGSTPSVGRIAPPSAVMAIPSGRKGPNVSQYLSDLNAIPSEHELANPQPENFSFEDDLAAFTNTEFYDFDHGKHSAQTSVEFDQSREAKGNATNNQDGDHGLDFGKSKGTCSKSEAVCFNSSETESIFTMGLAAALPKTPLFPLLSCPSIKSLVRS